MSAVSVRTRAMPFVPLMVQAIGSDLKTETRRLARIPWKPSANPQFSQARAGRIGSRWVIHGSEEMTEPFDCPYGDVGDRIAVKESAWMWCERRPNGKTARGRDKWRYVPMRSAPVHYVADGGERPTTPIVSPDTGAAWGWRFKSARFLPAWAVRTHLEITRLRLQRLQEITEDEARAEGCRTLGREPDGSVTLGSRKTTFRQLWNSINGERSPWDRNDWVWAITFRRLPQ